MWFMFTTALVLAGAGFLLRQAKRGAPSPPEDVRVPTLSFYEGVRIGIWFGLLTGVGQSYYLYGRAFMQGQVVPGLREVSQDSLWMAPIADMVAFGLLGAAIAVGSKLINQLRSRTVIVVVFAFPMMLTWIMVTDRLAPWAALLLAAGVAIRLGQYIGPTFHTFLPHAFRAAFVMGAGLTIMTAATILRPLWDERSAIQRLALQDDAGPNVVLIVLDTQRAATTSLYVKVPRTTPEIERLAETSVVFDRAIAPSPWTLPSHATMFTGRSNGELGTGLFTPLDDRYPTIAEVLRDAGYLTGAFVANIEMLSDFYGLDRGFTHYEDQPRSLAMLVASSWLTRTTIVKLRALVGRDGLLVRKRAESINHSFLEWVDDAPEGPFFAFLNYYDAHLPYDAPLPFRTMYSKGGTLDHLVKGDSAAFYSDGELTQLEATYAGSIRYLSQHVGALMTALDDRGLLESTLIIVTSDHGEAFGEHGLMGHGTTLYMPQVHIPLLIRPPGGVAPRRVAAAVGLADLPATILDVVGEGGAGFPGRSLLSLLSPGGDGGERQPFAVISEGSAVGPPWFSITVADEHFVRRPDGQEELYRISLADEDRISFDESRFGLGYFREVLANRGLPSTSDLVGRNNANPP